MRTGTQTTGSALTQASALPILTIVPHCRYSCRHCCRFYCRPICHPQDLKAMGGNVGHMADTMMIRYPSPRMDRSRTPTPTRAPQRGPFL
jgi:hypothetical protein